MSVDPSAIIIATATAVGTLVQGANAPAEVQDQVVAAVEAAQNAAPAVDQQVEDVIGQLPDPLQDQSQEAVDQATQAAAEVLEPYLPAAAPDPVVNQVSPPIPASPLPAPWTPKPGESWNHSDAAVTGATAGDGGVVLAPFPAALPSVSLTPVGAIAIFVPWLKKAGEICEGVPAPVLAALYSAENGFRYGPASPVSPSGARGPGQFMPGTWAKYGKDADGDGNVDINGIADSVMASGHLLCDIRAQVETWKQTGAVEGDTLDLTIAGYNAGAGAVLESRGMPSGLPDYENQTQPYVAKIRSTENYFAKILNPLLTLPGGAGGGEIVKSALRYLGLPYIWGGGNIDGPSGGGFDCSGLTSFAVYAATGVKLPRTSEMQWNIGTEIPIEQAQPGDLLFGNWQSSGPGHVAIYIGNGQMIHAPTTGDVVRIGDVFPDMRVRRIL